MEQRNVHLGRKRAISNGREPINKAVLRYKQATAMIHSNPVSTRKSSHVPEANVPLCAIRSIVPGARLRVLRVSATGARTKTSVRNTRLQGINQSNARELTNRAVRRNEQATEIIHSNPVSTRKSSQVPEANVPRCATRSIVPGARLRVLRVSTTDAGTKTSVGNTRLQGISQSKDATESADVTFDKKVDMCARTTVCKELKKAGCSCSIGINRDSRKSANTGVSRVNRRRAVTALGCTNKLATKNLVRELQTRAPEPQRRLQEANRRGVGTKQQEHGVPLGHRAPRGPCAVVHTSGDEKKTSDLMSTNLVKSNGGAWTRIPSRPPASVAQSGVRSQIPRLFSYLTAAPFRESRGRTDSHRQLESGLPSLPQQSGSFCRSVCRPPTQRASDFRLTTNPNSFDFSVEHRNYLTLKPGKVSTITFKHCSSCRDETVADVPNMQPPWVNLVAPYTLSSARRGMPAKGAWSASKPFPKSDAVVLSTSGVRLCSSLSSTRTLTPKIVLDINQKEPRVMSDADSEFLAPHHSVGVSNCVQVVEEACEQQQRSATDTTKLAAVKEKLRPFLGQKARQEKVHLQIRGAPVLRTAARALARAVASRAPAVPTVPACAARNDALSRGRPVSISKATAGFGHVLLASSSQTSPQQQTGSQGKGKLPRCLLRSKMKTSSIPEKPAVAKCVTLRQRRDLTANTKSCTVSREVKQKASGNDTSPPQLQPQIPKTALLAKDPCSVSSAQKKGLLSVALGGLATVRTRTRLVLPVCSSRESKPPLVILKTMNSLKDVETSARKAVAQNVRLQKLVPYAISGTSSPPKPKRGLEVSGTPSTAKCDPELHPLRPIPAEKPRKRPPQVPPLPLHLLAEILARKDAEEEAMRWEEGCHFDGDEGEKFDFRMTTVQRRSSRRQLEDELESCAFKSSLKELKSNSERGSAEHHAPSSSSGLPSAQLQSLAGTWGNSSVVEEGNGASPNAAASRAVGASPVISKHELSLSMGSQVSPQLHVQNKCDARFFRTSEQASSLPSLAAAQLHGLTEVGCRVLEGGAPTAVSTECDAHPRDLQQSTRHKTPEILTGVPRIPEADKACIIQGNVQYLNARSSRLQTAVFDTLNSSLRDIGGLPQEPLENGKPSKISSPIREGDAAEHVTELSIYQLAGKDCKKKLQRSHQDMHEILQQVIPETEAQQKAVDMPFEADAKWKVHRCVLDSPDEVLPEIYQWVGSCYSGQALIKEEAGPCACPGLQRARCHTSSRTLSQSEEQPQRTSQPPSLNACSHIRASKVASADPLEQAKCQPCSSYVGILSQAIRTQERPQRTTVNTQSQNERSPVQTRIQHRLRAAFRNASALEKNAYGSDKGHALSGQRQLAKTHLTLNVDKKEYAILPRTYASTQTENAAQLLRCTRKAAARSVSKHDEPRAVSEAGINARQSNIQPRNLARRLHPDLRRRPGNSTVKPSPAKENDFSCARQVVLPRENRPLGVQQQRNLRYPPRQPVRPSILHSPLTLYSTECKSEQRHEGPHLSEVLLLAHSTNERVGGSQPEPSVHTPRKRTKAAGNTSCQYPIDMCKSTVKSGSTCTTAQVTRPFQVPCSIQRLSRTRPAQTTAGLLGSRYAVSKMPSQKNPQYLSRMSTASRFSSLRPHVNRGTVSNGLFSDAAPAMDACGQRWRAQQRLDCRPCFPGAEGVLDAFRQLGTSSHKVQLKYTLPPFISAIVESSQEEQALPSWSDQGQRHTLREYCESCPAERQPFTEKQLYQCTRPPSSAHNEVAFEQPVILPVAFSRQNAMHRVIPRRTSSSTIQPLLQQLMHIRSAAQIKPSPAVVGHPGKPVTDSLIYCVSGHCHSEAASPEPDQCLAATLTNAIKRQNSKYPGVFSQAVSSQLRSPRSCVFLRPSTLTAH